MKTEEFDYTVPKDRIAQHPTEDRSEARLLVFDRATGTIVHRSFQEIGDYLFAGDLLVLNDTKVFPARLEAKKSTGGKVDILLIEEKEKNVWSCLAKGLSAKNGGITDLFIGSVPARVSRNGQFWTIRFAVDDNIFSHLDRIGKPPLPPYIGRKEGVRADDLTRYQTVYAQNSGSIAAPTAGFHFTDELLSKLQRKGVIIAKITLHIGTGTFTLIKAEAVEDHAMHRERFSLTRETFEAIAQARADSRRIVACGTSTVRTLETVFRSADHSMAGSTDLFIYPGYAFGTVDALITNFHLPRSTPLMLASAFAGKDGLLRCYNEAIANEYRFYSYGDAMLIL